MSKVILESILGKLTFDRISRSSHSVSVRASSLDHKSPDHAVEDQTVIKPFIN